MAKSMSIEFSDEDEAAIKLLMARYGQKSETGVIRLCLHMVAQARQMILETPADRPAERQRPDSQKNS